MKILRASELTSDFFAYKEPMAMANVRSIIEEVRRRGDASLREYTRNFDGVEVLQLAVSAEEIGSSKRKSDATLIAAITSAAASIREFATKQFRQLADFELETAPGVIAGQRVVPLGRVGIYVPGGRYPLISTLLMCAIPAQVAGVKEIAVCSPPSKTGGMHRSILIAADILGLRELYKVGGAQAIAAMAYGTESIRNVDKIVGPGNRYVAAAKREVFGAVGIDMMAGPTEVMIIADADADPELVASDMLAQAEHDPDAMPLLVTTSAALGRDAAKAVLRQVEGLSTAETASKSLDANGTIIIVKSLNDAVELANRRAPEHLELHVKRPDALVKGLRNFGTLFIGAGAVEALGDYSSGLNHTLPTNTTARYCAGLSVRDFLKLQTTLKVGPKGLKAIGPTAVTLARAEGLEAHARSVEKRMKK